MLMFPMPIELRIWLMSVDLLIIPSIAGDALEPPQVRARDRQVPVDSDLHYDLDSD